MAFTADQKREYNKQKYLAKKGILPEKVLKESILRPENIQTHTLRPTIQTQDLRPNSDPNIEGGQIIDKVELVITPAGKNYAYDLSNKPANYGPSDCQCKMCQQVQTNKSNAILNHGDYMTAAELVLNGYTHNRVPLPGDIDYVSITTDSLV